MKIRIPALISGLLLVLSVHAPLAIHAPVASAAQSRDTEAQGRNLQAGGQGKAEAVSNTAQVMKIIQKLRRKELPTPHELDVLEKVLLRDLAGNLPVGGQGKAEPGSNVVRAREIIQQLKAGEQPAPVELDFLETVLSRMDHAGNLPAGGQRIAEPGSNIVRAKEIIQKLRERTPPTWDELDVLETVFAKPPRVHSPQHELRLTSGLSKHSTKDGIVYIYAVDLDRSTLRSFWLDRRRRPYESIARLEGEQSVEGYTLKFAINGGIYDPQFRPKGLYIEQSQLLAELDTAKTGPNLGNFYLDPNGVFFIDSKNNARILSTPRFSERFPSAATSGIKLAVQSGPALLIDGAINPQFAKESHNKTRRTGVGILTERRVVFGISSGPISFYEFAALFKRLGCRDALFLDGGPIGALYSMEDRLSIQVDTPLVTILGVVEKMRSR
jgi:uncharacterized protein YigE (DUF2233 family)